MKNRSRRDTSSAIARLFAFIFSAIIAYFLWTYLRPFFVSPENTTTSAPITQEPIIKEAAPQLQPKTDESTSTKPKDSEISIAQTTSPSSPANTPESQPTINNASQPQPTLKTPSSDLKIVKNIPTNRTITVHNGIEKAMLGYKKFGTHYPTAFKITVGNTVLEQGNKTTATVTDNTLIVRYDFEFMNGYRNGAREVTVGLKPDTDAITLAFNWKEKQHLVVAEADKVNSMVEKDVPYQA